MTVTPKVSVAADQKVRARFASMKKIKRELAKWYSNDATDQNPIGTFDDDWEQISTWNPESGYKHREFIRSKVVVGSGVAISTECPDGSMYFEWQISPKKDYDFEPEPEVETPKPEGWGEFA